VSGRSSLLGFLVALPGVGVMLGYLYFLRRRELGEVRSGFQLAGSTDAAIDGFTSVVGTVRGRVLRYEPGAQRRASGRRTCEATMALPAGVADVEIHLMPQTKTTESLVRGGLQIDVPVGDVQFDPQVVVEAAPAELVRAVLDDRTREHVLALMPCVVHVAGGRARIERKAGELTAERVRRELALLLAVGERLATVGAEVGAKKVHALAEAGEGYRGVSAEGARAALSEPTGPAELEKLRAVRRERGRTGLGLAIALAVILLALWAAAYGAR
jgi:hypothetical protein